MTQPAHHLTRVAEAGAVEEQLDSGGNTPFSDLIGKGNEQAGLIEQLERFFVPPAVGLVCERLERPEDIKQVPVGQALKTFTMRQRQVVDRSHFEPPRKC
ncbi:MAG: hypothetical protein R2706_11450 [Acidimicrobiales bacterium]